MIKGYVDILSLNFISGWAVDIDNKDKPCNIIVYENGKIICEALANKFRKDLLKITETGKISFKFYLEKNIENVENVIIIAKNDINIEYTLPITKRVNKNYGYQTFDNQIGSSNSQEKLQALHLPERYDNLSVLDIACNEGFFCLDALKRGARRVVGIDKNAYIIQRAKQHSVDIEYICTDWWHLPDEKFDIIYFLSAIHYEKNQNLLLSYISEHLTEKGILILECGIYPNDVIYWGISNRFDGDKLYPSQMLLEALLHKHFYTRFKGRSVQQYGDDIPRVVYHCTKKQKICILMSGGPGVGKTTLARLLTNNDSVITMGTDMIFYKIMNGSFTSTKYHEIIDMIKKNCEPLKISRFYKKCDVKFKHKFVSLVLDIMPKDFEIVILEGYSLSDPYTKETIQHALQAQDFVIWDLQRCR